MIRLPAACANVLCTNRPGEGAFVLVPFRSPAGRGYLHACAPCGDALSARGVTP